MTTRRYLTNSTAPYTPATLKDTYNDAAQTANIYELAEAKAGTNIALAKAEASTTNNYKVLLGRWVSQPLTGGYTVAAGSDGITHTMARLESSASANMNIRLTMWVTVGDSDTVRGYLLNPFTGGTEFAITTATILSYALTFDNSFTIQQGDRIVVELGYNAANVSGTSFTGTIRAGGTAADLATSGTTGSTTNSPWVDFTGSAGLDAALVPYVAPLPSEVVGYASAVTSATTIVVNKANVNASLGGTVTDGDLLVGVQCTEWQSLSGLTAQTGTWQLKTSLDASTNGSAGSRVKIWLRTAASEPASWTFGQDSGADGVVTIIALRGVDVTVANIIAAIQQTAIGVNRVTPTVDHAGVAGSIFLAGASSAMNNAASSFTPPADLIEIADIGSVWVRQTVGVYNGGDPPDPTGTKTFVSTSSTQDGPGIQWAMVIPPAGAPAADLTKFFLSAN